MVDIVTGAAGFIGSNLVEELLSQGNSVVGIDNFHSYYSRDIKERNIEEVKKTTEKYEGDFEFIEGSITENSSLAELPKKPDNVYHNAAIAGVRYSIDNPVEYSRTNVLGTSMLLDYFDSFDKFVLASSSSVYGEVEEENLPVAETDDLNPIAPYPLSKVNSEQLVELYSELYDFDYAVLRYFTVYGPRQRPDEVFTKFILKILRGEPVTVYGDGEQSRDFTHVKDIVEANLRAADKGSGVYNIGSGRSISVNELVECLKGVAERTVEVKHVEQPEGDVRHTRADISKARRELDYQPSVRFEEGVETCFEWVRNAKENGLF